jgi:hypothetical protein
MTQREKQSKQYLMSLREGQALVALQVWSPLAVVWGLWSLP